MPVIPASGQPDYALGVTFDFKFNTTDVTSAPVAFAGSPTLAAYPDNSTTQITAGLTLTQAFDSVVGLHNVRVVGTSGNGYAAGTAYTVVIEGSTTVDGVSATGKIVGWFTLEKQSALRPATDGRELNVSAGGAGDADMVAISTDATAADNFETMLDGTGGKTLSLGRLAVIAASGVIPVEIEADTLVPGTGAVDISCGTSGAGIWTRGAAAGMVAEGTGETSPCYGFRCFVMGGDEGDAGFRAHNEDAATELGTFHGAGPAGVGALFVGADSGPAIRLAPESPGKNIDATFAELTGVPAAAPTSLDALLMLMFMALRNKVTVTSSAMTVSNDAGTTVGTKALADNGTTYTESEMA